MALNITIEVETESFRREAQAFMGREFQELLADALNVAGEAAVKAVRKGMMTAFERPIPFTLDGVRMYRASARTDGGDPSVLIFIADRTASYVDVHVTGGVRRAGDPFTTRRGPIVPGPAAPRDSFGNLPRGYTRAMMAEPDVEWVILKPGKPPALVRRRKGHRSRRLRRTARAPGCRSPWSGRRRPAAP